MVEAIIGALGNIVVKVVDKLPFTKKSTVPKQTLKFVLQPRGAWWHMGSVDGAPAMQTVCEWHATNITNEPIVITTAFIKKPKTEAMYPMTKHPRENAYGSYRVSPRDTTKLVLDFWINPPMRKEGEGFKATIVIKDQFNNEHKIKGVEFKYR